MILSGLVDCPCCGLVYEVIWADESDMMQDVEEAPLVLQECPGCRYESYVSYPGWVCHTEAGL